MGRNHFQIGSARTAAKGEGELPEGQERLAWATGRPTASAEDTYRSIIFSSYSTFIASMGVRVSTVIFSSLARRSTAVRSIMDT